MRANRPTSYWLLLLILVILVVGGFLRAGIIRVPGHAVFGAAKVNVHLATNEQPVSLGEFRNGFASVLKSALTAVVNISSTRIVKTQNVPDIYSDPLFRHFFGDHGGEGVEAVAGGGVRGGWARAGITARVRIGLRRNREF